MKNLTLGLVVLSVTSFSCVSHQLSQENSSKHLQTSFFIYFLYPKWKMTKAYEKEEYSKVKYTIKCDMFPKSHINVLVFTDGVETETAYAPLSEWTHVQEDGNDIFTLLQKDKHRYLKKMRTVYGCELNISGIYDESSEKLVISMVDKINPVPSKKVKLGNDEPKTP